MGQIQHTKQGSASARGRRHRRLGWRTCLRKDCGRKFQARRKNQRYCKEPECRNALRRWQAAKRQQKRRAGKEGRRQHAEAERQRRKERKAHQTKATETAAAESARGHAAEKHPHVFCDRPGCYEAVRESRCAPASYCCDECRTAMNRVLDRERKCLLRKRPAGRIKRQLEYQAACAKRRGGRVLSNGLAVAPSLSQRAPSSPTVVNSRSAEASRISFRDSEETSRHDSQASLGSRPRAPPAAGGLVVD